MSKYFLDAALINVKCPRDEQLIHFTNDKAGFRSFKEWLKAYRVSFSHKTIVIFEHTGLYHEQIIRFCKRNKISFCAENANHIKWSLGVQRGKNDKLDAKRIATYGYKTRETLKATEPPLDMCANLQRLLAQRERLMKVRNQLLLSLNEMPGFVEAKQIRLHHRIQRPVVRTLDRSIKLVEKEIAQIVRKDEAVFANFKLLQTIPGIGPITALSFIVYTHNFSRYKTGKKLACYCGVAPFERKSGISLHEEGRISEMANKNLKQLLHMGAITAIQHDPELKAYYYRKVESGKARMKVMNAVRNKLVLLRLWGGGRGLWGNGYCVKKA